MPRVTNEPPAIVTQSRTADKQHRQNGNDRYLQQTLRPIVCLAFVLPMLLIHELGSLFSDQVSTKSGIDQWFHWLLDHVGVGNLVILPLFTATILLSWHHRLRDGWKVSPGVLVGMIGESAVLGIILVFAGSAFGHLMAGNSDPTPLAITEYQLSDAWSSTVTFIGCGVYEELIFRLVLLSGLIEIGKIFVSERQSQTISIIITSLLFATLHFDIVNPAGAEIDFYGFIFRFSASIVFSFLFLLRGFGIAVGTHVFYDVMTQF